jgi:hypothetical protein
MLCGKHRYYNKAFILWVDDEDKYDGVEVDKIETKKLVVQLSSDRQNFGINFSVNILQYFLTKRNYRKFRPHN